MGRGAGAPHRPAFYALYARNVVTLLPARHALHLTHARYAAHFTSLDAQSISPSNLVHLVHLIYSRQAGPDALDESGKPLPKP